MNPFPEKPVMSSNDVAMWDDIISADRGLFDIRLGEIWQRRDLLYMFVWRDFKMTYKQTIFGFLWIILQPILMMSVYIVIFSRIARIPTDSVPPAIFYLTSIIAWNFFSNCLNRTVNTFKENSNLFGKVYFPRLIIPFSKIAAGLINFFIQIILLVPLLIYFTYNGNIHPNSYIVIVPGLIFITGCMGMGIGLIISSLSVTFRDLMFMVGFGVQLLMFVSAVFYPASIIPEDYRGIILWNPMVYILEAFRYALLGVGEHSGAGIIFASVAACVIFFSGVLIFNKVEQSFIDSV